MQADTGDTRSLDSDPVRFHVYGFTSHWFCGMSGVNFAPPSMLITYTNNPVFALSQAASLPPPRASGVVVGRRWARPTIPELIVLAALVVGIGLRVWLALVNAQANDKHLPVIRIIAFEHRFPAKAEEWEAFQPKLYHTTVAVVWRLMRTRAPLALTHAAQLVSCAAGVLTLLVLLRFLRERVMPAAVRAVAFALAALNPGLVGISAQATNDAFVILFASITLYFGVRFFARWRRGDFLGLVVAAVLAGVSKGNAVAVIGAVLATFVAAFLFPRIALPARRRVVALGYGALFVGLVLPAVAFIGPYASYQREFGTPFVTNWPSSPRPYLFRETEEERPGLTSLVHGLLTFRLVDLLRHPASTNHRTIYPRHRTSLWTRVYAQTHSARFEAWPRSWASKSRLVSNLTRLLFLLGLIPTVILGVGFVTVAWRCVRNWWQHLRGRNVAGAPPEAWAGTVLLLAAVVGHLVFVAVYSVRLRDYSSMKQIFVLPALLGFVALFAEGAEWLDDRRSHRRGAAVITGLVRTGLALLLLGYVADLAILVRHLRARERSAEPPSLGALPEFSAPPPHQYAFASLFVTRPSSASGG